MREPRNFIFKKYKVYCTKPELLLKRTINFVEEHGKIFASTFFKIPKIIWDITKLFIIKSTNFFGNSQRHLGEMLPKLFCKKRPYILTVYFYIDI